MGLLPEAPSPPAVKPGKFMRLFLAMDEDDRATIRAWDENPQITQQTICDQLNEHFGSISYAAVHRGLTELRENQWEA
jgi:hypothetical protein